MKLDVAIERFPIRGRFAIARGARTDAEVVVATLKADGLTGRGECVPYARYGETPQGVAVAIAAMADRIEGLDRKALQTAMPAGAARNALDCALIDLDCKRAGVDAAQLLSVDPGSGHILTGYTISLDTPQAMARAALDAARFPLLKIKLGGAGDGERLAAIRAALPQTRLIVDANEAWSPQSLETMLAACADHAVELVEQPLPAGGDAALTPGRHPFAICADESVHDLASLDAIADRYDAINVKLDKTGGLTHALTLIAAARARGLKVMVGCMLGTSLGAAPALVAARLADWVDLDGPLLLASDRSPAITYQDGRLLDPARGLWG